MRIRKLEILGFKSFPERTVLHFGSGLSCVIGPNGCGKSNIVDAIKWCVGEQSAKSLRGGEMADVIFAGSAERKPVGFAEVSITLSAEGGEPFPGDYARFTEVQVGRRLHRNGLSEYLINQVRCRRRDVLDLFMDTGVGSNLYSFIEQGRISEIVHASPERRRSLIDEAAGISRYKARRDEARQELEGTVSQLDRAADVADEMARRLRQLQGQVLTAARYRRLRALTRCHEIYLSLVKYADLAADRRALRARLREARAQVEGAERECARREADLEVRRGGLEEAEQAAVVARDEAAELEARRRELEGVRTFAERSLNEAREERGRAEAGAEEAGEEVRQAASEVEALGQEQARLGLEAAALQARIEEAGQALATAQAHREAARRRAAEGEEALATAREALAGARARQEAVAQRLAALPGRKEALRAGLQAVAREREGLVARRRRAERAQVARRDALEAVRARLGAAQEALVRAREVERTAREAAEHAADEAERRRAADEAAFQAQEHQAERAEAAAAEAWVEQDGRWRREIATLQEAVISEVEAARARARGEAREAEARGAAWLQALEAREAEELAAIGRAHGRRDAALEAEGLAEMERVEAEVREEEARLEAESRAATEERLGRARLAREQAAREVEACGEALAALQEREAGLAAEDQRLQGRLQGLEAGAEQALSRERGAEALRGVLSDPRPLHQRIHLEVADEAWMSAVLAERLLLPVATDGEEVLKASAAVGEARATLLWAPDGPSAQALLQGVTLVGSLEEALAHHQQHGGLAVVRDSGARVEADGVVRLGRGGSEASEVLKRHREQEALGARLQAVQDEAAALVDDRARAERALARARDVLAEQEAASRAEEEACAAASRQALAEAREVGQRRLAELRERLRASREAARERTGSALAQAREASSRRLAEARSQLRTLAERLRDEAGAEVERVRDALEGELEAARAAHAQALKAHLEQVEAARVQARASLQGLRTQSAEVRERQSEAVALARSRAAEARQARERLEEEANAHRTEQFSAEVALARADGDLAQLVGAAERLDAREAELRAQLEAMVQEAEALRAEGEAAAQAVEDGGLKAAEAAEAQATRQVELRAAEEAEVQRRHQAGEVEVRLAALAERLRATEAAAATAVRRGEEANSRRQRLLERVDALQAGAGEHEAAGAGAAAELAALADQREQADLRLRAAREQVVALREGLREAEEALRAQSSQREELAREAAGLEARVQEVRLAIEGLRERMDERYQVSLPGLLDRLEAQGRLELEVDEGVIEGVEVGGVRVEGVQPVVLRPQALGDRARVEAAVEELEASRVELSAIGQVNLAAFDEYRELAARHADLVGQRTDLEASVERIRTAIATMNRTCRQRFRDAFDRVNENFQRAYPRLVGGGTARLALTDEEDLLETGVDIFVQPPGKRLQNLTLLSGGEKAMAAIALLLALFQVKPSPFCLLDEVDAPLDEANGGRFNGMLREMSSVTQFIVITHNRKTMECADTLYGVTMPTPGVSRLVSVRIDGADGPVP